MTGDVERLSERRGEVANKLERLRRLMADHDLTGLLLTRPGGISWLTAGGQNPIVRGSDGGAFCWVLVTADRAYLLTQNIEGPRLAAEEGLRDLGFEIVEHPWYATDTWTATLNRLGGNVVGADAGSAGVDVSADLIRLRLSLCQHEQHRLRRLGADGAEAVEGSLRALRAGESERAIAARLAHGCELKGIAPVVLLVGSDARMRSFRHCPPSDEIVNEAAMVVLVGVRGGLNIACTRMASLGAVEAELDRRQQAACQVEAAMIAATVPGASYGAALERGIETYAELGWPGEHEHHYQGGPIGYDVREFGPAPRARPDQWTEEPIPDGSAFAWNPTVKGGKSEDTFLTSPDGPEWLTHTDSWPVREIEVDGQVIVRPAILEV